MKRENGRIVKKEFLFRRALPEEHWMLKTNGIVVRHCERGGGLEGIGAGVRHQTMQFAQKEQLAAFRNLALNHDRIRRSLHLSWITWNVNCVAKKLIVF